MNHRTTFMCHSKKSQGGFSILGAILVVVAIVGMLSVWTMSGQTNTSTAASSSSDVMGSSLVNDASAIKATFDTLLVNGYAASSITFIPNTAGASNILDPTNGVQLPIPNSNALGNTAFPSGAWIYKPSGFVGNNTGSGSEDQAMMLAGVKDGVCQQINKRIFGSTAIGASGASTVDWTTGALAATPTSANAVDLTGVNEVDGAMHGCVSTTDGADRNVYFRILKAN